MQKYTGSQYTFDRFEVTKANRKAFEKAKQFAENSDSKPLAIFGGTAAGKTHLLYAVKNTIEQNAPELKVIITTTADMHSSLISILSNGGTVEQFREKYMLADVLLVDDIQEFACKEKTQDELILIFNAFYESGKRFMMTSSQKEAHGGIKERLAIRSFWGEFAVIARAYINARFEIDRERNEKRTALLEESERLYLDLSDYEECGLEDFKTYIKNVWEYFSLYIGFFDVDREDVRVVSYLNCICTLIHCENISCLKVWEQNVCILFLEALIYTISSYDIIRYRGGFYGNGILFIQLPHHAGDNCDEITIDKFEERFNSYCEYYKSEYSDEYE